MAPWKLWSPLPLTLGMAPAALDWLAVSWGGRGVEFAARPGEMLALLLWLGAAASEREKGWPAAAISAAPGSPG